MGLPARQLALFPDLLPGPAKPARLQPKPLQPVVPPPQAKNAIQLWLCLQLSETSSEALHTLSATAYRYSAWVVQQAPNRLLLEVRGSLRLFGGLAALRSALQKACEDAGQAVHIGIAPTARAAAWLASTQETVADLTALRSALGKLPVSVLELDARQQRRLQQAGLRQLRDLLRLPMAALQRRFGKAFVRQLEEALGERSQPGSSWQPTEIFQASCELSLPTHDSGQVESAAGQLFTKLADFLQQRDTAVDYCLLRLRQDGPEPRELRLGSRQPSRDAAHFFSLLQQRLEREKLAADVVALSLQAEQFQPLHHADSDLLDGPDNSGAEVTWWQTIAQLQARLGSDAVYQLQALDEPCPEQAWRRCEPGQANDKPAPAPPRPAWMLETPLPLAARPQLCSSAERIEAGWWQAEPMTRDYHLAHMPGGALAWVYHDRKIGRWYQHGWFS